MKKEKEKGKKEEEEKGKKEEEPQKSKKRKEIEKEEKEKNRKRLAGNTSPIDRLFHIKYCFFVTSKTFESFFGTSVQYLFY